MVKRYVCCDLCGQQMDEGFPLTIDDPDGPRDIEVCEACYDSQTEDKEAGAMHEWRLRHEPGYSERHEEWLRRSEENNHGKI